MENSRFDWVILNVGLHMDPVLFLILIMEDLQIIPCLSSSNIVLIQFKQYIVYSSYVQRGNHRSAFEPRSQGRNPKKDPSSPGQEIVKKVPKFNFRPSLHSEKEL